MATDLPSELGGTGDAFTPGWLWRAALSSCLATRIVMAAAVDGIDLGSVEVQASSRLEATVPLGDGESLERLRQRTEDAVTRPAGSTALFDANIPSPRPPKAGDSPDRDTDS